MSGPISAPPTPPVDRVPSAQPLRLRGTGGDQCVGVGYEPAEQAQHRSQSEKLPDRLRHAHQYHDDRHAQCGAQQHQFTAASVGRGTPKWRGDSGKQEGDAEQQTGPHVERLMAGYAQRLYIQRKKRHHRAEGGAGEETPYRATKSYVSS